MALSYVYANSGCVAAQLAVHLLSFFWSGDERTSEASGFDASSAVPAAAARDGGAESQSVLAVRVQRRG